MDPLALALGAFIVTAIGAGISEARFYRALAAASNSVSSDAEVMRQFRDDPRHMPQANTGETRRRLTALVSRQADSRLENLRRIALLWTAISGVVFVAMVLFLGRLN